MFNFDHFESELTDLVNNLYREMTPFQKLILGTEHRPSMQAQAEHEQAQTEHEQARANFTIFRFWVFRARYHRFCEEFIKESDTFQKQDSRIPKIPKFKIFRFGAFPARYHRFCEEFIKGNDALPKLDFGGPSTGSARASTG